MANHFIAHAEIPSTNFDRAKKFYNDVFGWEFKDFGNGYLLHNTQKGTTIGLRKVDKISVGDTTIFHILVEDIDATLDVVRASEGKVEREKTVIPVYGWYALVNDPDGNTIGLFETH
jgi:uncharacterized protein